MDLESFREMLHICPMIPSQAFAELPFEEEILEFIRFLRHGATIKTLTDININKLYQPWRPFATIINKCLTRKSSVYDSLRLSQAQILWGLYHTRSIDYAFLIWEDFVYQVEHKNQKKSNEMHYPRFTKIHKGHHSSLHVKGSVHPKKKQDKLALCKGRLHILNDQAPKPKASARRKRSGSETSITPPIATTTLTTTVVVTPRLTAAAKGKKPAKAKSPSDPLEVARTKAQQLKIVLRRSRQQTHISQLGGSSTDKGTGSKLGVPDVPTDESEEELSWNSSDDEGDDVQEKVSDDDEGDEGKDSEEGEEDDDDDDKDKNGDERDDDDQDQEVAKHDEKDDSKESEEVDEEGKSDEEDDNEETKDEESFDPIPQTPESNSKDEGNGEEDLGLNIGEEERHDEEEEEDELYRDVNINQGRGIQATLEVHQLRSLEENFSEFRQTNQFAGASDRLCDETQRENDEFLRTVDENIKKIFKEQVKEQVKAQVSKILPRIEQAVNEQLEAEVLTRSSHSSRTSYVVAADLSEMELKKILIEKMEGNKVDTLTPELLAGPTYELMKGSCKSLIKLEYHMEEVYKATTDQLDLVNPEGQQYPHNLLQPLPLIPNNRGHRVIPFKHFINNALEYLRGGALSRKYTTSITKTKAADYEHIKWIEDLVPRTMWIQETIGYDKHALWGVSHWGRKRQQFYGFAVNRESARDVDDDKLYKFKEGDFKRLRIQDIEDMLLLLVQGKLTNLTVEERFAFNVSLRMFTRSIIIQRRVEDLQLGVESYQKKHNLTKPDSYRSDLKRKEAYTAYLNLQGFIYQNKDKKNMLMRIYELHKFSDGTLTDVRTTLDDRLKGIRMRSGGGIGFCGGGGAGGGGG
nr:hypothetical protein [Tanacetum cinerariifolium]